MSGQKKIEQENNSKKNDYVKFLFCVCLFLLHTWYTASKMDSEIKDKKIKRWHREHWGINSHLKITTPIFFCQARHLKFSNCPSPPFKAILPLNITFFSEPS